MTSSMFMFYEKYVVLGYQMIIIARTKSIPTLWGCEEAIGVSLCLAKNPFKKDIYLLWDAPQQLSSSISGVSDRCVFILEGDVDLGYLNFSTVTGLNQLAKKYTAHPDHLRHTESITCIVFFE